MLKTETLSYQYFMARANMIRELRCFALYDYAEVSRRYEEYIIHSDTYRMNPSAHTGFREIIGYNILDLQTLYFKQGLAFVLLHYGAYRHSFVTILERLMGTSSVQRKPVLIVSDQQSYNSEQELEKWKEVYSNLNCTFVIAEHPMTALRITRHIKHGGIVILYLDGMTGAGEDKSPIILPFISSHVRFRSGFFRLLANVRIPVIGLIASEDDNTLLVSSPIDPVDAVITASTLMSFFRPVLLRDPSQWRLWYRHHLFIDTIPTFIERDDEDRQMSRWVCRDVKPNLVLEEETGNVYPYLD